MLGLKLKKMKIKFKKIKELYKIFKQTNLNEDSEICLKCKCIFNAILIILFVDSKHLQHFYIWPTFNGTIIFDYMNPNNRQLIFIFDVASKYFSLSHRDELNNINNMFDKQIFSIKNIKNLINKI